MQAMLPTPNTQGYGAWFPNFGATNHVTNEFNNLNIGTNYLGSNKLHMV